MKDHELAELFPLMDAPDLADLAEDIKENGLLAPITLYEDKILDGRNRARACKLAGVEPKTREFKGGDPLAFVLSVNLHRRHLTESQRAMVAAKMATMRRGDKAKIESANLRTPPTITEAAEMLSVSPRLVDDAKKVLTSRSQTRAVERGEKTVHAAAKEIKAKKSEKEIRRDSTGYAIPEELWKLWDRRQEVQDILTAIGRGRGALQAAMERLKENDDDPLYVHANVNGAHGHLSNAFTMVGMALPHAVCPTCQGRAPETCKLCRGSGFIPKHTYDHAISKEMRAVRESSCKP